MALGAVQVLGSSVNVTNFPSVQTVAVNNFPVTQPISGTVTVNQGTSPWLTSDVSDGTTGSAVPAKACYVGSINFSGNLIGWQTAGRLGDGIDPDNIPGVFNYVYRGSNTGDRQLSIANSFNTTGSGIVAVGNLFQFDDVSPNSITENQFGNGRMSANRNQYHTIRDAAGNERGANVDGNNNLGVVLPAETTKVIGTVNPALIASVIVGQKKITASAVQLGSNALTNGVIFTALSTNAGNIFIGGSGVTTTVDGTGNGYILEPGSSISFAATNTNLYYVIGTANDVLSFAGS